MNRDAYRRAQRQFRARQHLIRQDALIRDWNRQRDIVAAYRLYWRTSLWLFAAVAFLSALGIVLEVL